MGKCLGLCRKHHTPNTQAFEGKEPSAITLRHTKDKLSSRYDYISSVTLRCLRLGCRQQVILKECRFKNPEWEGAGESCAHHTSHPTQIFWARHPKPWQGCVHNTTLWSCLHRCLPQRPSAQACVASITRRTRKPSGGTSPRQSLLGTQR